MANKTINSLAFDLVTKLPKLIKHFSYSRISLDLYDNNLIMFKIDEQNIDWFFSKAKTKDNKIITSNNSKIISIKEDFKDNIYYLNINYQNKNLKLSQFFQIEKDKPYFKIKITLNDHNQTISNYLVPLSFAYPSTLCKDYFYSLNLKMLLIPYDNDMWVSYEATPLKPGRTSYDMTCIYDEDSNNALLLGALEFDTFKNGIVCSSYDARVFDCISGLADSGTHDNFEHGYLENKEIASSTFVCGFYNQIKDALQDYGQLAQNKNGIYHWNHGVPFGWNSYSALTLKMTLEHLKESANFLYNELPNFKSQEDVTYINFDAVFGLNRNKIKKTIKELHLRNQKVGVYCNPLSHLPILNNIPLKGTPLKFRKDIILKDHPLIDGKYPIDITLPEAELDFRLELKEIIDLGYDYIKFDFLSHGAVEGQRHNPNIKTGRQALMYFYNIVKEELDPKKINKEIFISSSIAPLFPCGYSHSRRCSCDAFGHLPDTKYILNALTYSYWTNNTLYQFNDPDHTVLYKSLVDNFNETSLLEAKARYNASLISGTVMLLSDNYGPDKDEDYINKVRQRTKLIANNKDLNEVGRLNKAFIPLTLKETSDIYYLNKPNYLALFNLSNNTKEYTIKPKDINFPITGTLLNLNNHHKIKYDKTINLKLIKDDSVIFKLI